MQFWLLYEAALAVPLINKHLRGIMAIFAVFSNVYMRYMVIFNFTSS